MFTLQTTTFTMYSRSFGQELQPSRSSQPTKIHHEVFTIYPAGHPSRSTHVLLLLFVVVEKTITNYTRMLPVHPSRGTQPCLAVSCSSITKYSRVVVVVVVVVIKASITKYSPGGIQTLGTGGSNCPSRFNTAKGNLNLQYPTSEYLQVSTS